MGGGGDIWTGEGGGQQDFCEDWSQRHGSAGIRCISKSTHMDEYFVCISILYLDYYRTLLVLIAIGYESSTTEI